MLKPLRSNMLTIMFGTRTYSASDPLVQRLLHLGTEFMQLTGKRYNSLQISSVFPDG